MRKHRDVRNNKAREERIRQKRKTKLISARFPDVSRIVIKMKWQSHIAEFNPVQYKIIALEATATPKPGGILYGYSP